MRVVVTADDLGMSHEVDAAILGCVREGLVSSVSALATGPTIARASRARAALRGVSVGAHLDLSEFAPLTRVPFPELLVDGRFSARALQLRPEHAPGVEAELCAQVQRLLDLGFTLDHLDSHQHLHHQPVVRLALGRVARRFGITRVRTMGALRPPGTAWPRAWAQRARAWRFPEALRREGLVTTDGFAPARRFREGTPRWRTVEVLVHPGNPHDPGYAEELGWLAAAGLDPVPWTAIG